MTRPLTPEQKTIRDMVCAEDGHRLAVYFGEHGERYIACSHNPKHRTVARPADKPEEYNVITEERIMQERGLATREQLSQYQGLRTLTEDQAKDILVKLVPGAENASPIEVFKAARICQDYGLNPLMNHIFLVPFQKKDKEGNVVGETYATVLGIRATRLIASRRHTYSYIDFTPRKMTEEEERKIYGDVDPSQVTAITTLKDVRTGATASGYGRWPKMKNYGAKSFENQPKGTDKGNSMENMAMIRSERAAFDRLYPADMPGNEVQTIDETQPIEGQVTVTVEQPTGERVIDEQTGEIIEAELQASGTEKTEPPPDVGGHPELPPDADFVKMESASEKPEKDKNKDKTELTQASRQKIVTTPAAVLAKAAKEAGVEFGDRVITGIYEEEAQQIFAKLPVKAAKLV